MRRNRIFLLVLLLAGVGVWLLHDSWFLSSCWTKDCKRRRDGIQHGIDEQDIDNVDDQSSERWDLFDLLCSLNYDNPCPFTYKPESLLIVRTDRFAVCLKNISTFWMVFCTSINSIITNLIVHMIGHEWVELGWLLYISLLMLSISQYNSTRLFIDDDIFLVFKDNDILSSIVYISLNILTSN